MICTCFGKTFDLITAGRRARETARAVLGVPDYEAYLAHARAAHAGTAPMSEDEFYAARLRAKYGGFKCC